MKTKKIIILLLAAVIIIGCAAGAWLYFSNSADPGNSWVWAKRGRTGNGAISDNGYYYLANNNILSFTDFQSGITVNLCAKVPCTHDSEECDAHLEGGANLPIFFANQRIYYIDAIASGILYSRNETGVELIEIGMLGKQYREQQYSLQFNTTALAGEYIYYSAIAVAIEEEPELKEKLVIGRINLVTGKDEILVEEERDKTAESLVLCAAKNDSCLFFRQNGMDISRDDPNYTKALWDIPVSLNRWDAETGEVTTLFEKSRGACETIQMVEGDNIYYSTMYNTEARKRCDTYRFNMETGKETLICENATLYYLGGGYALYKTDSVNGFRLMNLKTGSILPVDVPDISVPAYAFSNKGIVLSRNIRSEVNSSTVKESIFHFIRYDSLADGLQEADLLRVGNLEYSSGTTAPSTTPTTPSIPSGETTTPDDTDLKESTLWIEMPFDNKERTPDDEFKATVQYLPETVNNPKNLPVLKWVCLMDSAGQVWTEDAVHELNQMLADRNMPFRVQFIMLCANNFGSCADWFSRPVAQQILKDADLIYGRISPIDRKEYLMPITEYATGDALPTLKNAVPHKLNWLTGTTDGKIYGIPCSTETAYSHGWSVDTAFMKEMELTKADFTKNFWEMDELFAKIYEKNGNKPFLYASDDGGGTYGGKCTLKIQIPDIISEIMNSSYQTIGAFYTIDYTGDTPKITNMLETDAAFQTTMAVIRYKKAGYVTKDKGNPQTGTFVSAYESSMIRYDTREPGEGKIKFPTSEVTFNSASSYDESMSGILASSLHKDYALMLLNQIAEDEAFRTHLFVGKEGRDYTITDGVYQMIVGEDKSFYNMDFLSPLSYFCDTLESKYDYLPTAEGKTKLKTYQDSLRAVEKIFLSVPFSNTAVKEEWTALGKATNAYWWTFTNTTTYHKHDGWVLEMTEARYKKMLQVIKDAGGDKIQAELQRQLDEWLANNPDWDRQFHTNAG